MATPDYNLPKTVIFKENELPWVGFQTTTLGVPDRFRQILTPTELHIHNDTWIQCDEGDESFLLYDKPHQVLNYTTAYLTLLLWTLSSAAMTPFNCSSARTCRCSSTPQHQKRESARCGVACSPLNLMGSP